MNNLNVLIAFLSHFAFKKAGKPNFILFITDDISHGMTLVVAAIRLLKPPHLDQRLRRECVLIMLT